MVRAIHIYVEGGGNSKIIWQKLRKGMGIFLKDIREKARHGGVEWAIIPCGNGEETYKDFCKALSEYPKTFNVLLVDSDGPATKTPWEHLAKLKKWKTPQADDKQCHLMAQVMEAWLIADADALSRYYGDGFKANKLPKKSNIEELEKNALYRSLKAATRGTQKGTYNKTEHGFAILATLNPNKVRKAYHCNRLFETLEEKIGDSK